MRPEPFAVHDHSGPLEKWLVVGWILGPVMPSHPMVIDGVEFGAVPLQDRDPRRWRRSGEATAQGWPNMVTVSQPWVRIDSAWGFNLLVDARDGGEAEVRAHERFEPLLAAFVTIGLGPYRIELMKVGPLERPAETARSSRGARFWSIPVSVVGPEKHDMVAARWRVMRDDRPAAVAARDIANAVTLSDLVLAGHGTQETAVLEAFQSYRSSGSPIDIQVRFAGEHLGLPEGVIADAIAMAAIRNRRLGHAGPPTAVSQWLDRQHPKAIAVAAAFLAAYADTVIAAGFERTERRIDAP